MMQRFISDTQIMRIAMPSEYQDYFKPLLTFERRFVGTVGSGTGDVCVDEGLLVPHSTKRSVFNSSELEEIRRVLLLLRPTCTQLEVYSTYAKYSTIKINRTVYGSIHSHAKNTSIVITQLENEICPARIEYFAKVSIVINGLLQQ